MTILQEAQMSEEIQVDNIPEVPAQKKSMGFWEIINIEVGEGRLDDYITSPLNFDNSKGMARMLWSLAGIVDASLLRSAVINFIIGVFQWVSERKKVGAVSAQNS